MEEIVDSNEFQSLINDIRKYTDTFVIGKYTFVVNENEKESGCDVTPISLFEVKLPDLSWVDSSCGFNKYLVYTIYKFIDKIKFANKYRSFDQYVHRVDYNIPTVLMIIDELTKKFESRFNLFVNEIKKNDEYRAEYEEFQNTLVKEKVRDFIQSMVKSIDAGKLKEVIDNTLIALIMEK